MQNIKNTFLIISVILMIIACQHKEKWKTYVFPEGGFTIDFPGEPKDTIVLKSIIPAHDIRFENYNESFANNYYSVSYLDLPGKAEEGCKITKSTTRYDAESVAQESGGQLSDTLKRATMNGVEADEYTIQMKNNIGVITLRYFCHKGRLYTFMIATRIQHKGNTDIARFFNSFILLKK